ncbi:hypothetical protein BC830DRAFT_1121420, partial [Chytriomyces sp. MP71]
MADDRDDDASSRADRHDRHIRRARGTSEHAKRTGADARETRDSRSDTDRTSRDSDKNNDDDKKKRRRRRSRSRSSDSSSSGDSSDSGSGSGSSASGDRDRDRRRKKHKHKDHKAKKDKKDRKDKKRKKDKKSKKDKKERKKSKKDKLSASASAGWGSHGIISSIDMYTKEAEFRSWLMEVKGISPEERNAKSYFDEFIEDYNTGTLPHAKYYDMDAWDRKTGAIHGGSGQDASNLLEFDFARDEAMLKAQQRASKASRGGAVAAAGMSVDELRDLKRVQDERTAAEKLRKMGVETKNSTAGVRYEMKQL